MVISVRARDQLEGISEAQVHATPESQSWVYATTTEYTQAHQRGMAAHTTKVLQQVERRKHIASYWQTQGSNTNNGLQLTSS